MKFPNIFSHKKIHFILDRDSVCLADDVESHKQEVTLIDNKLETILMRIAKKYLPHISGDKHHWECMVNHTSCAVINSNCSEITITQEDVPLSEGINHLYFYFRSSRMDG